SPETPYAFAAAKHPVASNSATIPVAAVHRNGRLAPGFWHHPTTTCPSADTAVAWLSLKPGSTPRSSIPPAAVHRNARTCGARFVPTTTVPSPETPAASLAV